MFREFGHHSNVTLTLPLKGGKSISFSVRSVVANMKPIT